MNLKKEMKEEKKNLEPRIIFVDLEKQLQLKNLIPHCQFLTCWCLGFQGQKEGKLLFARVDSNRSL